MREPKTPMRERFGLCRDDVLDLLWLFPFMLALIFAFQHWLEMAAQADWQGRHYRLLDAASLLIPFTTANAIQMYRYGVRREQGLVISRKPKEEGANA